MTLIDRLTGSFGVSLISLQLKREGFQLVAKNLLDKGEDFSQPLTVAQVTRCSHRLHQSLGSAWMPWSTCLTRAIWLSRRLRSDGLAACIKLGVHSETTAASSFKAHAWVEVGTMRLDQDETLLDSMIMLKPAQAPRSENLP